MQTKAASLGSAFLLLLTIPAQASSHREAPGITELPKVDGTDFYMFNSYESGRAGYVTLLANYIPLQDAYGGPNYFELDPDARYNIHIDNDGDGIEDITFQLACALNLQNLELEVGGVDVAVPLVNLGQISTVNDPQQNVRARCTLSVARGELTANTKYESVLDAATGNDRFPKPVDNIGQKSIPNYAAYAAKFIRGIDIPGCAVEGRVFTGQRKEGFAVNLGEVFDLVNTNPVGPRDAEPNALADKNVTTFALEVSKDCLKLPGKPVIGGWTTSWLPRDRTTLSDPTFAQYEDVGGPFVQVSRLGMPLVNEIVIGLKDKNLFNASEPEGDAALATYITNPTLPAIIAILFPGVDAPTNFPRLDLVATFATGIQGLNVLTDGSPHEMLRLNTNIAAKGAGAQNNLGALGGDRAGFPNGRRPGDDVVDIELRVAMGVLCHAFPGLYCSPADAPSGTLPYTDGTLQDASQFNSVFPYLKTPLPGSPNGPNGIP